MSNMPKAVGRKYKPFDLYGWIMCIFGILLLCKYGGVGWIFGTDRDWWKVALILFVFWEFAMRVAFGRVYKFIYYDTILYPLYEVEIDGERFFVNAENEDELSLYLELNYPNMPYKILRDTHTEAYIKTVKHF